MIGISKNKGASKAQKKIEEEIDEEMQQFTMAESIEEDDNYSDEEFNFGLNEV